MEEEKDQHFLSRGGQYGPHCDTGRSRSQLWEHMLRRTLERATERVAMVRLVLRFGILASCLYCFPVPFPITKQPCRLCRHLAWDSTSIPAPEAPPEGNSTHPKAGTGTFWTCSSLSADCRDSLDQQLRQTAQVSNHQKEVNPSSKGCWEEIWLHWSSWGCNGQGLLSSLPGTPRFATIQVQRAWLKSSKRYSVLLQAMIDCSFTNLFP